MTEDQDQGNGTPGEEESKGCLLMVASYADVAGALEPAVASIATRILASPTLGDFVGLRFVDAGFRPAPGATSTAVPRILDALAHPASEAAQNYFAVVFADQSAAVAAGVLRDCRTDPVLAGLPLKYRGLAVIEDRPGGPEPEGEAAPTAGDSTDIVVSASGKWTARTLSEELLRYAEQLFRYFATTHERGVTSDELAGIRGGLQPAGLVPPRPDPDADDAETDLLAVVPAAPSPGEPGQPDQPPGQPDQPPGQPDQPPGQEPAGGAPRSWPRLPRWRLALQRPKAGEPPQVAAAETGPPTLVFMLLHGDTNPDEQSSWRRGRSLMAEVDRGLAAARPGAFKVRAFSGKGGSVKTPLSEAGHLSSRDVKRPDPSHELGPSLRHMHSVLQKDLRAVGRPAAGPEILPVMVIFAVEIPVADVITAEAYIALALDTTIIWVVPADGKGLMSRTFSTSETHILPDHNEVADDVVSLVLASVTPQETPDDQNWAVVPEPSPPAAFVVANRQQARPPAE